MIRVELMLLTQQTLLHINPSHQDEPFQTSDDERKVEQEYQKFKRKQNQVSSICDKKIQEFEEQDYLSLKGSKSISDPNNEEELKSNM